MKKQILIPLAIIFLAASVLRIYFALQQPYFSDDGAYFMLRQAQEIADTGTPIYHDPLSYGGRSFIFLPVFHYMIAGFALFFNVIIVSKILPNLLAATVVIAVFLICRELTKNDLVSLVSAFASGFVPVFISETINSVSVQSVAVPATFFLVYFLMRLRKKVMLHLFLLTLAFFLILSTYSLLIVLSMMLFLVFTWVEGIKLTRSEIELTIFSLFLTAWFYLLFYRDALLVHGHQIIWQNIPGEVINVFFSDIDILLTIVHIGIIPLLSGFIMFYYYIFKKKKKQIYLLLSLTLLITLLLLNQYIELSIGLSYIGIISAILLSEMIMLITEYVKRTNFAKYHFYVTGVIIALFIMTSVLPSIDAARSVMSEADSKDKVVAMRLLHNTTKGTEAIAGSVFDGHLITYFSDRKNIVDSNFLLVDAKERLRDTRTIFTSAIESKALETLHKYGAEYLLVTEESGIYYNISKVAYADSDCMPLLYSGKDVRIYQRKC